jgi:hypothetical protein
MGLALLLYGPPLILGGPADVWIHRASRVGTVLGAGMIVCGGALL